MPPWNPKPSTQRESQSCVCPGPINKPLIELEIKGFSDLQKQLGSVESGSLPLLGLSRVPDWGDRKALVSTSDIATSGNRPC